MQSLLKQSSMRRWVRTGAFTLVIAMLAISFAQARSILNGIAARVGDELILWSDVAKSARSTALIERSAVNSEQMRERLIEDMLVEQEARQLGRSISETQIVQAIDRFASSNGLTQGGLREAVEAQQVSWDEYRDVVRKQLLRAEIVQLRVRNTVMVSQSDIEAAYRNLYRPVAEYHLRLVPDNADEAIDLGWVRPDEVQPQIQEAIRLYADGSPNLSQTIDIKDQRYKIDRLEQRISGGPGLENVEDQLREELFQQRLSQAFDSWIAELKARTYIERHSVPRSLDAMMPSTQ